MPRVVTHTVIWLAEQDRYVLREPKSAALKSIPEGADAWFAWLAARTSFAFQGQQGHLTLRREARARKEEYWYAYRCQNKRTIKRYAGRTADLAIERLEKIADEITTAFAVAQTKKSAAEPEEEAATPLLLPKLRLPHLHSSLIARERLLNRLDSSLERKLTTLRAPAGFGKTTLVRQWIAAGSKQHSFPPIAWISLDSDDNDPTRFWRYIFTAAQSWYAAPDQHAPNLLIDSSPQPYQPYMQPPGLEAALTTFLNDVTRQNITGLLILEDYHVITEARIHETLSFFLAHLPETLHLVLITRQEPPLPLVRLRANGDLNEIVAADLRFSAEESATFLQDFALSSEALERLDTHLEGWAAGLRLLRLSLQGKTTPPQIDRLLAIFGGSHRPILDYFLTEVLHAQPEQLQDFLLRTSVLTRLSPSLCIAVTGIAESEELLESCERANLFLEALDETPARDQDQQRGESEKWYRYHALFAQAMQHEARRRLGEDEFRKLSYTASIWFEEHGLLADAIEAALKAEENSHAINLIEQFIQPMREMHEHHTIRRWLERLPQADLHQSPRLCLTYAASLMFTQPNPQTPDTTVNARIEEMLHLAEEGWRAYGNLARLGEVLACRSFFAFRQGQSEQATFYARESLPWLPEKSTPWRGLTLSTLGINALQTGQFNEAQSLLQEVARLWEGVNNVHALEGTLFLLGLIAFEQCEIHQAIRYYRKLQSVPQHELSIITHMSHLQIFYEWNDPEAMKEQIQKAQRNREQFSSIPDGFFHVLIELANACIDHSQGETEIAIQRLTDLIPHLSPFPDRIAFFYSEIISWLIRLSLSLGDLASAQYWLNSFDGPQEKPTSPLSLEASTTTQALEPAQPQTSNFGRHFSDTSIFKERKTILIARIFLAQGEAESALDTLNSALPIANQSGRKRTALQIKLLLAQAYAALKQIPEAQRYLTEALEQGYPQDFQRIFLDEGERLRSLLRDLLPHLPQPLRGYTQRLLHAFAQPRTIVTSVASTPLDPLTMQEQRVLRLLVAGRSNPEIARELVVSVNTVRTQVQSIYRKLNVNNRNAASAVARQLQLV